MKLKSLLDKARTVAQEQLPKVKPAATKALAYAKENPDTVLTAIATILLFDIEDSLEDIEDNTDVSAYTDAVDYLDRYGR
jgi:hypothetical protein